MSETAAVVQFTRHTPDGEEIKIDLEEKIQKLETELEEALADARHWKSVVELLNNKLLGGKLE